MTRDQALAKARIGRDTTGFPHAVGMRSDGEWFCHELTGHKITDFEDNERFWRRYQIDEARAELEGR